MKLYKIIHIPAFRDPYQRSLLLNLEKFDLEIKYGRFYEPISGINLSLFYNYIRYFRVDLIHLHWQHPFLIGNSRSMTILKSLLFIAQMLILKLLGVRFVWTIHNLKNHDNKHKDLELFFSKFIAEHVEAIIAHCQAAREAVHQVFKADRNKIVVIPHGNFIDIYKNTFSREKARNFLNLSSTDFIFFYMGLIRSYKGLVELVRSFRKLDVRNTKLIVAGSAQEENLLNILTNMTEGDKNILLRTDGIPEDEVQIYMNAADIIVLPYKDILTSGVAHLGMSFGKAIIAPSMGCMPELLGDSGGFLYNPYEQNGLLKAMRLALNSESKLVELGKNNLDAAKGHGWSNIAISTYEVYKMCLDKLPSILTE